MSLDMKIKKNLGGFQLDVELHASNETLALLGASGCGIIYATDAYSAEMTPVGYADPEMTGGPCIYPVAVMQNSKHQEEAKKFVDYLFSEEAMAFFTEVGFTEIEA